MVPDSRARKSSADTIVRAPFAGIVDVRAAQAGEVVTSGQPIVTVINPDDLWIRADIEETYIDRVRIGDRMHVRLPSGTEAECPVCRRPAAATELQQAVAERLRPRCRWPTTSESSSSNSSAARKSAGAPHACRAAGDAGGSSGRSLCDGEP